MALDLLSISDPASTCYNSNSPCDGGRAAYKWIDDISLPVRSTFAGVSYQWRNVPRMSTTGGFYGRRGAIVSERVTCKCKDKNKKVIKEINPCRMGHQKKKQKTKKQKVKMTAGRLLGIVNYRRAHRPMHACNKKKVTLNTNHHVLFHALSRTSLYSLSTTIADAAPPPLQMAATPFSPFFKACTKVTTIREPEEPIGCVFFFSCQLEKLLPRQKKKRRRRT